MKTTINGLSLAYDDLGDGPAVVLIHGFPLSRRMWKPQAEALAEAGFRVIAPDLRGFGESEASEAPPSMDAFAEDLIGLLDHLGVERAVVGGMSMGGYVLLNLLDRYPQRVSAAVFMVTRAGADDEPGKANRTALAEEVRSGRSQVVTGAFEGVLFAPGTPLRRPELLEEVRAEMACASPRGLAGALLAMRDRTDYTARLGSFTLPSLVVSAEQDRAVAPEHAEILVSGLPHAAACAIPDAGHMVNLERPEAFNACLLQFLRSLFPG